MDSLRWSSDARLRLGFLGAVLWALPVFGQVSPEETSSSYYFPREKLSFRRKEDDRDVPFWRALGIREGKLVAAWASPSGLEGRRALEAQLGALARIEAGRPGLPRIAEVRVRTDDPGLSAGVIRARLATRAGERLKVATLRADLEVRYTDTAIDRWGAEWHTDLRLGESSELAT